MYLDHLLEGRFINLRSVCEEDASFILDIRNRPSISKYLPSLNVTEEQQKLWIKNQREDNTSYYFIIEDKERNLLGTISVYNIDNNCAETGRFCSQGNYIQNAEATLLLNDFVFNDLNISRIDVWVYKENKAVVAYNHGYGCIWDGEDKDASGNAFLYGKVRKDNYLKKSLKIREALSTING